jgi:hypothetical protein
MSADAKLQDAIRNAIGAHGAWKLRLKVAITNRRSDLSVETVSCDDRCDFGRWLHGADIPAELRKTAFFRDIVQKHANFHRTAGQVLSLAMLSRNVEADALLAGEFAQRSSGLTQALQGWQRSLAA